MGRWFLNEMKEMVEYEEEISKVKWAELSKEKLAKAKEWGFSDKYLAEIFDIKEKEIREKRKTLGITARYEAVSVSGVKDAAYYYSTYKNIKDEIPVSKNKKAAKN